MEVIKKRINYLNSQGFERAIADRNEVIYFRENVGSFMFIDVVNCDYRLEICDSTIVNQKELDLIVKAYDELKKYAEECKKYECKIIQ